MTSSTITSKGQTTIPKSVRDRMHLKTGDRVEFVVQDDGTALLVPTTLTLDQLKASVPRPTRSLSLDEIDTAVHAHAVRHARRGK